MDECNAKVEDLQQQIVTLTEDLQKVRFCRKLIHALTKINSPTRGKIFIVVFWSGWPWGYALTFIDNRTLAERCHWNLHLHITDVITWSERDHWGAARVVKSLIDNFRFKIHPRTVHVAKKMVSCFHGDRYRTLFCSQWSNELNVRFGMIAGCLFAAPRFS
jgi:hypothetical protein